MFYQEHKIYYLRKILTIVISISVILAILPFSSFAAKIPAKVPAKTVQEKLKEKEKKVKEIKEKQDKLRKQLQEITQQYQDSYTKYILIKEKVQRNKQKLEETSIELDLNQDKLSDRVVGMYKNREDMLIINFLLNIQTFDAFLSQLQFLTKIGEADTKLLDDTEELRNTVQDKQFVLEKEKIKQKITLVDVETKQEDMKRNLDAQQMLEKLISKDILQLKQRTMNIDGLELSIVFPVNGPHSYINDWHFPRSGGRLHKGTDIFAAKGTPAVATTNGVIGKTSPVEKGLGGITVWLYGDDNVQYYYAHLQKIADGITVGTRVTAGQVVGYVGNSGNARTTPPHLHFQIEPGGIDSINPYPFLVASDPYK